jgi:hypothetical protein
MLTRRMFDDLNQGKGGSMKLRVGYDPVCECEPATHLSGTRPSYTFPLHFTARYLDIRYAGGARMAESIDEMRSWQG